MPARAALNWAPRDAPEQPVEETDHLDAVPHAAAIGMQTVTRNDGHCIVRVPWAEHLVGDPDTGVLHGGVITAVLDNASGMAVRREGLPPEQHTIATLDLRIDYMRPARAGADLLVQADCTRMTRSIAFVRAVAHDGDLEDPVATSVAAFMLGSTPATPAS
jgi:uncharacterized protein (TIGR00369 family)